MLDPSILQIFTTAGIVMFQPRRDYVGHKPEKTPKGWLIPPGVFVMETADAAVLLKWNPGEGGLSLSEHPLSETYKLLSGPAQVTDRRCAKNQRKPPIRA